MLGTKIQIYMVIALIVVVIIAVAYLALRKDRQTGSPAPVSGGALDHKPGSSPAVPSPSKSMSPSPSPSPAADLTVIPKSNTEDQNTREVVGSTNFFEGMPTPQPLSPSYTPPVFTYKANAIIPGSPQSVTAAMVPQGDETAYCVPEAGTGHIVCKPSNTFDDAVYDLVRPLTGTPGRLVYNLIHKKSGKQCGINAADITLRCGYGVGQVQVMDRSETGSDHDVSFYSGPVYEGMRPHNAYGGWCRKHDGGKHVCDMLYAPHASPPRVPPRFRFISREVVQK